MVPTMASPLEWSREATRLYERYAVEVVEGFGLCPWAARARSEGRVRVSILPRGLEPEGGLAALDEIAADPGLDIGLLVYPRAAVTRAELERFVAELRELDTKRAHGASVPMAMAPFHPEATPDTTAAHRLIPFLRRTPDPTIQLVRCSTLSAVREGTSHGTGYLDPSRVDLAALLATPTKPPLHERVAVTNLRNALEDDGLARLTAVIESIHADRAATYAKLAE